jgi:hypothetical protein
MAMILSKRFSWPIRCFRKSIERGERMAQDRRILNAIMVVVNECLGILETPQLDQRQRAVLICILSGMAHKSGPLQKPFNRRLVDVMRMQDENAKRKTLLSLLGLRL